MVPMEPGSLIMERKMLQGIKGRAENLARSSTRRPNSQRALRAAVPWEPRRLLPRTGSSDRPR